MGLHQYFDRVYCVTLPQREALFKKIQQDVKKLGGEITPYYVCNEKWLADNGLNLSDYIMRFDYIDTEAPANWRGRNAQSYNYCQCFFNIIQKCKDEGVESLLYLEDDVCFLPYFNNFLPVIMENAPKYWEMIYFGPGHHGLDGKPSKQFNIETPYLYRSQIHLGMQAVAIHSRMYDMLLELRNKPWLHENPYIDITIAHQFHKGNSEHGRRYCYGAFPYLVCETSGFSYNENKILTGSEYELWKGQLCN